MPRSMRVLLLVAALVTGMRASGRAEPPRPLPPPPSTWSDTSVRNAYQAVPQPTNPAAPRPLQSTAQSSGYAARAAQTQPAAPAPQDLARPAAATQPIKLTGPDGLPGSPLGGANLKPLVTGGTSLGIVLGLFLLVVWTMRRGSPRTAGIVPAEAVEVLGRVPIAGRQQAHLVRCGNKIVLVSVTTSGVEPLTEITDPMEVDRLEALCRHSSATIRPLKGFLARFGSQTGSATFGSQRGETLDFEHLGISGRREV